MKQIISKISPLVIAGIILIAVFSIVSCSKTPAVHIDQKVTSIPVGAIDTIASTDSLTLVGVNFANATVTISDTGVTISGVKVSVTGDTITAIVTVDSIAIAGNVAVSITTPTGSDITIITLISRPPPLIGGYTSSDSVASANLVAYWPFDGTANEFISETIATTIGVSYATGIRGLAYQGAPGAYATLIPSAALAGLNSYSVSVWYFELVTPSVTPYDPGGMFFMVDTANNPDLILDNEPYSPVSGDSVELHAGFYDPALAQSNNWTMTTFDTDAVAKWVHFVMTYDGPSSTYTVYQDGVSMLNQSALGWNNPSVLTAGPAPSPAVGNLNFSSEPPASIVIGTWPAGLNGISPTLGANGSFLGLLDELRIYNRALTQTEVTGLYLNGLAGR
jgi:hypothetical protein